MSVLDILHAGLRWFSDADGASLLDAKPRVLTPGFSVDVDSELEAVVLNAKLPTALDYVTENVSAHVNNLNPTGWQRADFVTLDLGSGSYNLTGMVAPSGSGARRVKVVRVVDGELTLLEEDAGSLAANRLEFSGAKVLTGPALFLAVYNGANWSVL